MNILNSLFEIALILEGGLDLYVISNTQPTLTYIITNMGLVLMF